MTDCTTAPSVLPHEARQRSEKRLVGSILFWAGFGAAAVGLCTSIVSTALLSDRLKDGAQATIVHAVDVTANSVGGFLRHSEDIVWQVTSRSRARTLLADLNAGAIGAEDYRTQTQAILGDALARSTQLRGIARFDDDRRLVAAVGEAVPAAYAPRERSANGAAAFSAPFDHRGTIRMAVSAPILDRQGAQIGTDVALFSLEPLSRLLSPQSSHRFADWELDLFIAAGGEGRHDFYRPSSGRGQSIVPIGAADMTDTRENARDLETFRDGVLVLGEHVFAAMTVGGSDWIVFGRRSTADLYSSVYRDIAISWGLALALAAAGTLGLLFRIRPLTAGLLERLGGLRSDVETGKTQYRELIEGSLEGILIHRDYKPLLVNRAWAAIHGYGVEEVMALESIVPLIAPDDRERLEDFRKSRLTGRPTPDNYEYEVVHRSGRPVWVQCLVREIEWEGTAAIQATIFEITERKEREAKEACRRDELEILVQRRTAELGRQNEELERALGREREYNAVLDQFVTMASHEFRTPLTVIDSTARRIARKAESSPPEDVQARSQTIRNAVRQMIMLIESILDSAKSDRGELRLDRQPCSLAKIVRSACQRQQDISPSHRINVRLDDLPERFVGDPQLLDQVFANLLSNAVKYAPNAPEIEVLGMAGNGHASVSIKDEGLGIPEAEQPKLFDRFFRASTSSGIAGTGIGLNLVARIVDLHGGQIRVESREDQGSTFTVTLPLRPTAASHGSGASGSDPSPARLPAEPRPAPDLNPE